MADDKKNPTQLMFGISKPIKCSDPQAISGPERFRSYIDKNRAFGAALIAMSDRKPPPKN